MSATTMRHLLGEQVEPHTLITRQFVDVLFGQLERLKAHFPTQAPGSGDQLMQTLRDEAAKRSVDNPPTEDAAKRTKTTQ